MTDEDGTKGDSVMTLRVPRELLAQAQAKARQADEKVSQVLRRALRAYVTQAEDMLQLRRD